MSMMSWTLGAARNRRRGIALITSMLVCLFLVMLTGALIQNQSGALSLAQTSDGAVRARSACQSVYDYCVYQIEHSRTWGSGRGFESLEDIDPTRRHNRGDSPLSDHLEIRKFQGHLIEGYLSDHGCRFTVTVKNALTMPAAGVSTEHVTLEITAWDGDVPKAQSRSVQGVNCRLRLAPLYDSSILSRGDVTVNAREALFASKDLFRNEIRAEGSVALPALTEGKTRFVKHNEAVITSSNLDLMTPDSTGLLWSGGDIAEVHSGRPQTLDQAGLSEAARRSSGRMVDKAANRADIYDLKPENIPQPTNLQKITVPPGEFRFTKASASVTYEEEVDVVGPDGQVNKEMRRGTSTESIDVLEYYDPPNSPQPLKVMRRETKQLDSRKRQLSVQIDYGASGNVVADVGDRFELNDLNRANVTVSDPNGNTQTQGELGFRKIGSNQSAPVVIDLSTQTVSIQPGTKVQPASRPANSGLPPSAFELTTKQGTGGIPELPTFQLGSGNNDVVFEADGDVSIGVGYTKGIGTVISKQGSVTLNPLPQQFRWARREVDGVVTWVPEMEISANSQYAGLVVYADKDVTITNISNAEWNIRGFVYARNNFTFNVNNENATFFGSVVAGNSNSGNFLIDNGKRATFIYDPEYLKLMTRQLQNNWTRLEPLVWSESRG